MESERTLTIAISEIDDWQIVLPDDTLRGGFTNRAVFRIMEREGTLRASERKMLERFRDD